MSDDYQPPLEDDRTAMMLGLVPDKRTPAERLLDAVCTGGESLRYHYDAQHHWLPVVRTDAEIDALPVGSVLFDADLDVIVRAVEGWRFWGDESTFTEDATICLPALVLHRGGDPWHAG